MKRAETSFFASIIQNIELFNLKNLVCNTGYCIFAASLLIKVRPKIVKKGENYKFWQLKNMNGKKKEWCGEIGRRRLRREGTARDDIGCSNVL